MHFKIGHPSHKKHFESRNILLQESLRPKNPQISIVEEYPIVLNERHAHTSYCMFDGDNIIAHLNLLTKRVTNDNVTYRLGLIGNVATSEKFRGQGLMRKLIDHVSELAVKQDLQALLLWSDLDQFYQTLGFMSCGTEWRIRIIREKMLSLMPSDSRIACIDPKSLMKSDIEQLLALRYPLPWQMERTAEEFTALLQIPWMLLVCEIINQNITSYAICGKGYDLAGVFHEWGGRSPDSVLACANYGMGELGLNDALLLTPSTIAPAWLNAFEHYAREKTPHPMGLLKQIGKGVSQEFIASLFCWGIDSI